jgi:threonine dehydratase
MELTKIRAHEPILVKDVRLARRNILGVVHRTPLLPLNYDQAPAGIYMKLENLQPTGAFKLRGAANAMAMATEVELADGVFTSSSGNMAQAVAWNARRLGVPCTVLVPDTAPATKVAAVARMGAKIISVPFDEWWEILITQQHPLIEGRFFVHPSSNADVMAGYGTIGLEILEDLPDVDAVLVPWGSGGQACALGSLFRALKPDTKIYAVEVDTGAPFAASLSAGHPVEVPFTPSFVDGMSGPSLPQEMWPVASRVLEGSLVVTLQDIVDAIGLIADRNNFIAEGAGAAPVAAALRGMAGGGKVACVITGGNLDVEKLKVILDGQVP